MITERITLNEKIKAELASHGIVPMPDSFRNGTTHGLHRSLPDLYKHVEEAPPRKFQSFPANWNGRQVFIKLLIDPKQDFIEQLRRDIIAGSELVRAAEIDDVDVSFPRLLHTIDEGNIFCAIYELLPEEYEVVAPPFLQNEPDMQTAQEIIDLVGSWQQLGTNGYRPTIEFMQAGGYTDITYDNEGRLIIDPTSYEKPQSIKGLSGMPTLAYMDEFRTMLLNPRYYLVESDGEQNILREHSLDIETNLIFTQVILALNSLSEFDFNFTRGFSFVHNDLGPQNLMINKRGENGVETAFVDMENVTIAPNYMLGRTADVAHLVSRLWYNKDWQDKLIESRLQASEQSEKIAFLVNLLLEALRRITRPITYYAFGEEAGEKVFEDEMIEYSRLRYESNLRLINFVQRKLLGLLES